MGMLVLHRKRDEDVVITVGDQRIVVKVVGFDGHGVRLGFNAHCDIEIHRGEVQAEIDAGRRYEKR